MESLLRLATRVAHAHEDDEPGAHHVRLFRDVVMVLLALASIGILVAFEIMDPGPALYRRLLLADLVIVAIFWGEYLYRLSHARNRKAWMRRNWYEILGMIPILPGMEELGGVRLFRLLRILRILRLVGVLRQYEPVVRFFNRFAERSRLGKIALLSGGVIVAGALAVWLLEPQEFPTFWDALWWAIVSATTVGYGDYAPATAYGRAVAVMLMILGIGLIGTLAGTLSSFLVEERGKDGQEDSPPQEEVRVGVVGDLERLARLHREGQLTDEEFSSAKQRLLR